MPTDLFLFFVGIFTGAMNAIAGGGMLVGFPALLATGLSALSANATSNIVVMPGQLASAFAYRKYLRTVPKRYLLLLIPCVIGAIIGALILRHTSSAHFENLVPWLILMAVALFAFQPLLRKYLHKHMHSRSKRLRPFILIAIALLPLAIYGGYFGAGFGFVMLALLGFTKLKDIHQLNAMKNVAATAIGTVCIIILAPGSFINWHAGTVMALGSIIGGYGGAHFAQRISSHAIRITVIGIGVVTAAYLVFRSY